MFIYDLELQCIFFLVWNFKLRILFSAYVPLATSSIREVFWSSMTEGWITPLFFTTWDCFDPPPPATMSIPAKNSSAHTSMAVSSASGAGASQWSVRLCVSLRASNIAKNLAAVPCRSDIRRSVGVRGHACCKWKAKGTIEITGLCMNLLTM